MIQCPSASVQKDGCVAVWMTVLCVRMTALSVQDQHSSETSCLGRGLRRADKEAVERHAGNDRAQLTS